MIADNYRKCPCCLAKETARVNAAVAKVAASYGVVSAADYDDLKAACQRRVTPENLAEYYELGVDRDGKFFVSYSCCCRECGFKHTFKHEEQTSLKDGAS